MMKINHAVKAAFLTASLITLSMSQPIFAETISKPAFKQQELEKRYYVRDYQTIRSTLHALDRPLNTDEQLLLLAIRVQLDEDDADDALEGFTKTHSNNAKVQYWAGNLWQTIAKNSNMFSKMSIYSHYVKAMTQAAKLEPTNARYQMEAAKAYGQPSMMGGDSDQQQPIVAMLLKGNSPYAHIAYMDFLQNTQQESKAIKYASDIAQQYKNNVEIVERAAQLLWTFDKVTQAGELFYQACMLPAPSYEAYTKWDAACWYSTMFSKEERLSIEKGIAASTHLLSESAVKDEDYLESLQQYAQLLVKAEQNTKAISAYKELLTLTTDKSMKRNAQKALKKLTKG